jgi:hypothetical protein
MSSWVSNINDTPNGVKRRQRLAGEYRTECKLGKHIILKDQPYVWLKNPMGISCVPCAAAKVPDLLAEIQARTPAKVPAPRRTRAARKAVPA